MNVSSARTGKDRLLAPAAITWASVTMIGQLIFVLYIVALYWISGASLKFDVWNKVLPHGYRDGNLIGNILLSFHLVFAAVIMAIGITQLVPRIRERIPKFHRIGGRIYIGAALIMSLTGMYLIFSGRKVVGDAFQQGAIFVNSLYIFCFASLALWNALNKNFRSHRKWALRLFVSAGGVWLFRVGLMAWIMVYQKPVGFNPETFSGPFLTVLSMLVYILPVVILELYFQAQERTSRLLKWSVTTLIYFVTAIFILGIFGATIGLWIPRAFG